ncbi:MAG: hypothetical protein V3W34_18560 [Phycisphaerae bacterium]
MRSNILYTVLITGTVVGTTYTAANAVLPDDQTVEYRIHETPTDPKSAVVFVVRLELTAEDSAGYEVGWEITTAQFRQPGTPDTTWTEDYPYVDTTDGLWWVKHADPEAPEASEFVLPPWLLSTATADDPQDDDLDYDLEGVAYSLPPPPGEPPYENTAALDYSFTLAQQEILLVEGDDEPVDAPNGVEPPD